MQNFCSTLEKEGDIKVRSFADKNTFGPNKTYSLFLHFPSLSHFSSPPAPQWDDILNFYKIFHWLRNKVLVSSVHSLISNIRIYVQQ